MTKSKLTHVEKDEVIANMQLTMQALDEQFNEHLKKNIEFVEVNAAHTAMQHRLIENLNAQVTVLRAANWLLTAVVGILVGVGSYVMFWG